MISIIFPTYNEQESLRELHRRVFETVAKMPEEAFEFVFVDDCSSDNTAQILKELHAKDPRVKVIRFAHNCGSHAALTAGLNYCKGECAIVMAADLQDPPGLIVQLLKEWKKGRHLVWGVRSQRKGETLLTRWTSRCYYLLMNWLTSVKMPPLGADVFLADRKVLQAFQLVPEKHTSVFLAMAWLGFHSSAIAYVKEKRYAGKSKWSLGKKVKLTIDSLLAFTDIPIRYMSILGLLTAFSGFLYALIIVWNFFHGAPVAGWSSLIIVVLVIGGVQMTMLGILGEYLWRTYDESRRRPRYIEEYIIE